MSSYNCSCGESFEEHGGLAVHLRYNPSHDSETKLSRFMKQIDDSAHHIAYLLKIEHNGDVWYYAGETKRPYERFSRHLGDGMEIRKFPDGDSTDYDVCELVAVLECSDKQEAENTERILMLAAARWFNTFRVLGGS